MIYPITDGVTLILTLDKVVSAGVLYLNVAIFTFATKYFMGEILLDSVFFFLIIILAIILASMDDFCLKHLLKMIF